MPTVIWLRAALRRIGPIAMCLAAACGMYGAEGAPAIPGSNTPCQFQDWMQARQLAGNPYLAEALAPHQFMQVPSGWLPLADGSGHFISISFDGTMTRDGVLVVFTCDGQHVLTANLGRMASISLFPGSTSLASVSKSEASYLTVFTMRLTPGREQSVRTYYRFYRNRLAPVGELVTRDVAYDDSLNAIEKTSSGAWRAEERDLIPRCVETRRIRRETTTSAWRVDSSSRRAVREIYRLEKDKLRQVSRGESCTPS